MLGDLQMILRLLRYRQALRLLRYRQALQLSGHWQALQLSGHRLALQGWLRFVVHQLHIHGAGVHEVRTWAGDWFI